MKYTPEQIEEAKRVLKELCYITSTFSQPHSLLGLKEYAPYVAIILTALETAERENSEEQEYNAKLLHRTERAEAYAAKLEADRDKWHAANEANALLSDLAAVGVE